MPGLRLYSSNRLEVLAQGLSQILARPLSSPLTPETIVVQSRGMERWLTLNLAGHLGVLANCRFPFPATFLQMLFATVLGQGEDQVLLKEHMAFRLMGLLDEIGADEGFASIAQYLADDPVGLKRYALARNLADSFDQYLVFRPRMVLGWEEGRSRYPDDKEASRLETWQAALWRSLATPGKLHRANLSHTLLEALTDTVPNGLPERVSIFGISYLPPIFIEIFEALARHTDVHLFLMNPCADYWANIQSLRAQERIAAHYQAAIEDMHMEEGNPLLAGLGSQGKYFIDRICASEGIQTVDDYRAPETATMLGCVQNDILTLSVPQDKRPVLPGDTSIQVHACHSPMREVEVLHDHLLDMFQHRPGIRPEDILVMAPAIETYAPYVEAVFDSVGDERSRVPFSIADRPSLRQPAIEIMLSLMEALEARMQASAVMSLLEISAIHTRFGMTGDDLPSVRDWLARTRIRWGYDGPSKAALGLPPEGANTWRAGLDRMLLGFCMPQAATQPWREILPFTAIEGENAELLGQLCEFIAELNAWMRSSAALRSPQDWAALLAQGLDTFCDPDLTPGRQELRLALERLAEAPFPGRLSLAVVKAWLTDHFRYPSEHGFLAGGVTCCSLLPMRSIPFKVICLLGLDNDTFPRQQIRKGFDLMTVKPERGDRSRRDDDRYLFLEALVSARETLYLSYVGQDQQDNSVRPPSVLVSEILDYLDKTFAPQSPIPLTPGGGEEGGEMGGERLGSSITRVHRLHGFSSAYFSGSGTLFSYSAVQAHTAAALERGGAGRLRRFIAGPLEEGLDEWRDLDVQTLVRFFEHPVRFFLEQRLGMRLPLGEMELENREPFELKGLERYAAGARMVEARLAGLDPLPLLEAEGVLPHGLSGVAAYAGLDKAMAGLVERIQAFASGGDIEKRTVEIACNGFHITGGMDLYPRGALFYRTGRLRAKDLVGLWIRHVLLNVSDRVESRGLGCTFEQGAARIQEVRFMPVDALPILAGMLDLFAQGLTYPLAIYPESSHAYAKAEAEGGDGLAKARSAWAGSEHVPGEGDDKVYHFHPGEADPFPDDFNAQANAFFAPLLQTMEGGL